MKYIDYFAFPKFGHDSDALYKARLLAAILLNYIVITIGASVFLLFFSPLPASTSIYGSLLFLSLGAIFVFFLHFLRTRGIYTSCTHGVIFATYVGIAIGVYISGGPIKTPSGMVIVMPAILAFCLLGLHAGLLWTLVIFSSNLIGMGLALSGFQFIQIAPAEMEDVIRAFNWIVAFLAIVALVVIYEQINSRLKNERDEERDRYKHMALVAVESSVVTDSAEKMAKSGDKLLFSALEQKTAIESLATTTEELGATAEQNTHLAASAKIAIKDTEDHLLVSKNDILKLVNSMNKIKTSSQEIQSINNVINDISFQTNILSLNAMIEASRSSAGGGFKVVALEVKRLAESSAKAAESINHLLESNFDSVQDGVELSETMKLRFEEIQSKIRPLSETIQNVADASVEQNEAIRQITSGLMQIDDAIEANKLLALDSSTLANQLKANADSLMQMVKHLAEDAKENKGLLLSNVEVNNDLYNE